MITQNPFFNGTEELNVSILIANKTINGQLKDFKRLYPYNEKEVPCQMVGKSQSKIKDINFFSGNVRNSILKVESHDKCQALAFTVYTPRKNDTISIKEITVSNGCANYTRKDLTISSIWQLALNCYLVNQGKQDEYLLVTSDN